MFVTMMIVTSPRIPLSRRERPWKRALSREWIVETTIEIMRREGLQKATMRRVAQALDTGPASLYVYVSNTAELHAAVIDELVGALSEAPEGNWRDRLDQLLRDYQLVLLAYPGLARSALVTRPTGPNSIRMLDRLLGLLIEGGIEPGRAAWGVDLLLLLVTASAAEHAERAPDDVETSTDKDAEWSVLEASVRRADAHGAPNVAAHANALLSGTPGERWAFAVHALVAGIGAVDIPTMTT